MIHVTVAGPEVAKFAARMFKQPESRVGPWDPPHADVSLIAAHTPTYRDLPQAEDDPGVLGDAEMEFRVLDVPGEPAHEAVARAARVVHEAVGGIAFEKVLVEVVPTQIKALS